MTYPSQPTGEQPYSPQVPYTATPAPGEYYQHQQATPAYYPQPGQYPPLPQEYGQPYPYTPQGQYIPQQPAGMVQPGLPYQQQPAYNVPMQQLFGVVKNVRAGRALFYGILSIVLGLLTLITLVGAAGLITGAFAVFYGFIALNASKTLPNNMGRNKALVGIILGFSAIGLVILSFIIRGSNGSLQ